MDDPHDVTDAEIASAFQGTNFGEHNDRPRPFLATSVLKVALGYHCGSTITAIMLKMNLVREPKRRNLDGHQQLQVTERGRVFCYAECNLARSG